MTENQEQHQELLELKSRHRRRMREIVESRGDLTPALRSELQMLENGQLDLERKLRAALRRRRYGTADTSAPEPAPPQAN